MNISPVNSAKLANSAINFGDVIYYSYDDNSSVRKVIKPVENEDTFKSSLKTYYTRKGARELADTLPRYGIKAKIRKDSFLEVSKLNALPIKIQVPEDMSVADYILMHTKKVNGSVDFGEIGATNFGNVEVLEGAFMKGSTFDISGSEIYDLGKLKKIKGNLILNPKQLTDMNFEGLEITGKVIISLPKNGYLKHYRVLSESSKDAMLHGFTILTY